VSVLLVLNAGSSSLKFAGFAAAGGPGDSAPRLLFRGLVEGINGIPQLMIRDASGVVLAERRWPHGARLSHGQGFDALREWLDVHLQGQPVTAVGHRVVHGGGRFDSPVRVDADVLRELESLVPLAPLHQPHNLAIIRAISDREPGLPQVACFDTAFHRTLPMVAQRLALPRELYAEGIRRYGFHGLSYEFIARRLREIDPAVAAGRVVVAHLGAGASLCALDNGRSVETTMGFTALDGLVMGTRCGAIDPGVLLYLLEQKHMTPAELSHLLYFDSGLLGVSGISSDLRQLSASSEPAAREAIELFVYRATRELAAMVAALGGLDGLVFTGGIGENNAAMRQALCSQARFLRLDLDAQANGSQGTVISSPASAAKVFVLPTDEEQMIALHARAVLNGEKLSR